MRTLVTAPEMFSVLRPEMVKTFGVFLPRPVPLARGARAWETTRLRATQCFVPAKVGVELPATEEKLRDFYGRVGAPHDKTVNLEVTVDEMGKWMPDIFKPHNYALLPGSSIEFGSAIYGRTPIGYYRDAKKALQVKLDSISDHLYTISTLEAPGGILLALFQLGLINDDDHHLDAGQGYWPMQLMILANDEPEPQEPKRGED
ncbi:MAG: hypothetical protein WC527_04515 [Candidatus Margulisiibacteriota bacterium]